MSSLGRLAVCIGLAAPINPFLSAEVWSSAGHGQEFAAPDRLIVLAKLSSRRHHVTSRTQATGASTTEETSEDEAPPSGAVAAALAPCEKSSGKPESLTLPGAKGEVKLDRCYRGRDQLVCALNTLSIEAKTLVDDFAKIVDANYQSIGSVDAICKIAPDDLSAHLQKASTFLSRFKELRNEYDRRVNCATKVEQSLKEVSLADMPRSEDILKSMNDTLQGDMKDVATARQRIADLAERMDSSQKAMAIIQKIHRSMCLSAGTDKPVSAAQDKPVAAPQGPVPPVSPNK